MTPFSSKNTRRSGARVGAMCATRPARGERQVSRVRRRGPFFLIVKPSAVTARQMVATLASVPRASFNSPSVRSGWASIKARSSCRRGVSFGVGPCRCARGATSPSRGAAA